MVDTENAWRQDTECSDQDLDAEAARRDGHRAPELQPWPDQAGRGRESAASAASAATAPKPAATLHAPEPVRRQAAAEAAKAPLSRPGPAGRAARSGSGVVLRTLTEDERSARASALADAKVARGRGTPGWPRKKPRRRANATKASSRPSAKPPKPAARPRKTGNRVGRGSQAQGRGRSQEAVSARAEAKPAAAAHNWRRPLQHGLPLPRPRREPVPPSFRRARSPARCGDDADEDEGPRQIRRGTRRRHAPRAPARPRTSRAPAKERGRLTLVTALNRRRRARRARSPRSAVAPSASRATRHERAEGKADPRSGRSRKRSPSRNSPTACRSARSTSSAC